MRRLPILLTAGAILSGCAASPPVNPWAALEVPEAPAVAGLPLPRWPLPTTETQTAISYDRAGVLALEAYRQAAAGNERILEAQAAQVDQLAIALTAAIRAGQGERAIAELRAEILAEERRHFFFERAGYWALLLALAAAAL